MMNENNVHIIVLVGNEADESFLIWMLTYYQEVLSKSARNWEVYNVKGIRHRIQRVNKKNASILNSENVQLVVFAFCSDMSLYPFAEKPVIDWDDLKRNLLIQNIAGFYEVKVDKIIEDWILDDLSSICEYLNIKIPNTIEGENGYKKISSLFRKASKQYITDYSILDLLPYLSLDRIRKCRQSCLLDLEKKMGVEF